MGKSIKRSIRRHHRDRLKKKRASYWGHNPKTNPMTDRCLGIFVHTPCLCSCWMCCNERRFGRITLDELRDLDRMADGLKDMI